MRILKCPRCKSNNTGYQHDDVYLCFDCHKYFLQPLKNNMGWKQ